LKVLLGLRLNWPQSEESQKENWKMTIVISNLIDNLSARISKRELKDAHHTYASIRGIPLGISKRELKEHSPKLQVHSEESLFESQKENWKTIYTPSRGLADSIRNLKKRIERHMNRHVTKSLSCFESQKENWKF